MGHVPTVPNDPEVEAPVQPDQQEGAFTNCDCSGCREKRLGDERHQLYTPHDMCDAWRQGWAQGFEKGAAVGRRVP